MKKIIATLALCLMAATAFSQSSESMTLESGPKQFFTFEAFYGPSKYLYTGDDLTIKDEEPFTQIGLVLSNYNPLSKTINLYFNWGVGFVFSQYKNESGPSISLAIRRLPQPSSYISRHCTKPMWVTCSQFPTPRWRFSRM